MHGQQSEHYDLVVLGCGPAGEKAAAQAAYFGKKVAVIDRATPGGACVHTGTLPSKGLRESALAMVRLRNLGLRGMTCSLAEDVRVEELMAHRDAVCATEVARILHNLDRHGCRLLHGQATLMDAETVVVTHLHGATTVLHADVILIATGARPHRPADLPFDHDLVWDSDELLEMSSLPRSLLIYGAGVIGCEYASIFAALGVHVHLIEPRSQVLPFVDRDIAKELLTAFAEASIAIHTSWTYDRCEVLEGEGRQGEVRLWSGDRSLQAERLLYTAGRNGNCEGLGLEALGIKVGKRGHIEVDANYHTGIGKVYAAGDIIGFPSLASASMDQGRLAVCRAFGFAYKTGLGHWLPYGIYTIPECSQVGATEQELEAAGRPFEVGRAFYPSNARAQLIGAERGLLKLIFAPDDLKLLGVHVVGERASELVHIGMTALQLGGTLRTFVDAVYNYPTLSELFKYAAYDGLQRVARREAFDPPESAELAAAPLAE